MQKCVDTNQPKIELAHAKTLMFIALECDQYFKAPTYILVSLNYRDLDMLHIQQRDYSTITCIQHAICYCKKAIHNTLRWSIESKAQNIISMFHLVWDQYSVTLQLIDYCLLADIQIDRVKSSLAQLLTLFTNGSDLCLSTRLWKICIYLSPVFLKELQK